MRWACKLRIIVREFAGSVNSSLDDAAVIAPGGSGQVKQTAYSDVTVTEAAVVNSKGQVLNNVVIHTISGHQYPQ